MSIRRFVIVTLVLSVVAGVACAQPSQQQPAQQQPPYVPIIIDQATWGQIQNYLGEQPAKFAIPFLNLLGQMEIRAQEADAARRAAEAREKDVQPSGGRSSGEPSTPPVLTPGKP